MSMYVGTLESIDEVLDVILKNELVTFSDLVDYAHLVRPDLRNVVYNNSDFWFAYFSDGQKPPSVTVNIGPRSTPGEESVEDDSAEDGESSESEEEIVADEEDDVADVDESEIDFGEDPDDVLVQDVEDPTYDEKSYGEEPPDEEPPDEGLF